MLANENASLTFRQTSQRLLPTATACVVAKVNVSLMFRQTSQRLQPHLKEPLVLSSGYNFALTK